MTPKMQTKTAAVQEAGPAYNEIVMIKPGTGGSLFVDSGQCAKSILDQINCTGVRRNSDRILKGQHLPYYLRFQKKSTRKGR